MDGNPTATWVDQDKGLIQIPIDEAMAHELVDLKNVPVAAGAEIPGSTPAPAPAPATTNAAPAAPTASTNTAPASPAKPAAKKPAKSKKPVKEVNTTSVSPDQGNQPVFKTRAINKTVLVRMGSGGVVVTGTLMPSSQTPAAMAN